MLKALAATFAAAMLLTGCDKPKVPEVHNEGTVCYTVGASAVDKAGHDLLCKVNDRHMKRWVRVR